MSIQDHVDLQVRKWLVGKAITCPRTGAVLDVRTAVIVESASGATLGVLSPEGWDEIKADVMAAHPTLVVSTGTGS